MNLIMFMYTGLRLGAVLYSVYIGLRHVHNINQSRAAVRSGDRPSACGAHAWARFYGPLS